MMNSRSAPLDLLRTLAIFLVFTNHFHAFARDLWFGRFGEFGWVGVDLFFVLSGFLISSQLFKEIKNTGNVSLQKFYIRRGLRIWPNYFFVLALYIFIPAFVERGRLAPLWKFFTFTQNFGLDFTKDGAFSHAWSLCVEEQFYLALPLLLVFFVPRINMRKSILLLIGIFSFGVLIRNHAWREWVSNFYYREHHKGMYGIFYRVVYYPTYCRLDSLATGVGIAALVHFRPALWGRLQKWGNAYLLAALVLITLLYFLDEDGYGLLASSVSFTLNAVAFGLLLLAALSPQSLLAKIRLRWVTVSSNLAFAFYLLHKSLIHLCKNWFADWGLDPGSVLYPILIFLVCLTASVMLYLLIEKPILQWRDRLLHARSLHFKK